MQFLEFLFKYVKRELLPLVSFFKIFILFSFFSQGLLKESKYAM